jgi:excisionase family DNA binding protein
VNKKEAAEFLGKTERAVERYKSQGKLTARYEREVGNDGRPRKVAHFDADELAALKVELDKPYAMRPQVVRNYGSGALATTRSEQAEMSVVGLSQLIEAMAARATKVHKETIADLAMMPLLTIKQAARFYNLPESMLRTEIHAGNLAAFQTGRGYRILREKMDAYIKKLK